MSTTSGSISSTRPDAAAPWLTDDEQTIAASLLWLLRGDADDEAEATRLLGVDHAAIDVAGFVDGGEDLLLVFPDEATHDDIVRSALAANGGRQVKHTGDGIMACFPSATAALEAAWR